MFGYGETFQIVTEGVTGQDADGNDVYGVVGTPTDVRGAFAPAGSTELVNGQATVITHDTVYLDMGYPAPGPKDRMLVRGVLRDVDGVPAVYRNPWTGWQPGPVVRLVAVTG